MKRLIDILAVELKEFPSDCNFIGQASDGTLHKNYNKSFRENPRWTQEKYTKACDWSDAWLSRAEWQAAVDALNAPKVVEWDEVGLPPAGVTCERRFPDVEGSSWMGGIVLARGSKKIFFRDNCGDEWAHSIDDVEFRPFRTAEQVAAEERMAAAYGMCAIAPSLSNVDAIALYDASYRKQVLK